MGDLKFSKSSAVAVVVAAFVAVGAGNAIAGEDDPVVTYPENRFLEGLRAFRENVDFVFRDRILSPLTDADRAVFEGLIYFDPDPAFALPAEFESAPDRSVFAMPTYNNKTLSFTHHGTVTATIEGSKVSLEVFRRESDDMIRDVLLIPFRDPTNGTETYGGGRYIEIDLPLADELTLDFNRAMNPWCAYDPSYACPIPPRENQLRVPIRAGEKRYE